VKKQKLISLSVVAVLCGILFNASIDAQAVNQRGRSMNSELTLAESAESMGSIRGRYLSFGDCSITKAGNGRIYVYGGTTASTYTDYVGVFLYVDQYDPVTELWNQIDFVRGDSYNAYFTFVTKTISVARGYYYRVHADHFAGPIDNLDDVFTYTNGIWVN